MSVRLLAAALTAVIAGASALTLAAPPPVPTVLAGQSDLDAFMAKVMARRDENWKKLQQYILDEREQMEVRGLGNTPIWGERRDYTWYLRDGFFVRSPVKVNGMAVSEADRRQYENDFLRRVKERDARRGRVGGPPAPADRNAIPSDTPADVQSFILQTRQPQFVDSAYFLRFKFEEAKYALVGHETFDGRDVLRIEYYPARLFSREQDQQRRRPPSARPDRRNDMEVEMERLMNKVALVTVWVEPASQQISTFNNVNLEFLPIAWLAHMDEAKAVMTMSQPLPDVWLPRDVDFLISATLAIGSFDMHYHLEYQNYRKAETSSRVKPAGDAK